MKMLLEQWQSKDLKLKGEKELVSVIQNSHQFERFSLSLCDLKEMSTSIASHQPDKKETREIKMSLTPLPLASYRLNSNRRWRARVPD